MPVIVNSYARGESRASLEMETGEYKPSSTKKSPSKILLAIFENIILFLIFAKMFNIKLLNFCLELKSWFYVQWNVLCCII